jgi:Tfp pilus assembly protein PilE
MPKLNNQLGVSLIELLLAGALVVAVVVTLSLAFPAASTSIIRTQQRTTANNLASAQIEYLRSQVYLMPEVQTTDTILPAFNASCDCRLIDWNIVGSTSTQVGSTVYNTASCIHFVTPGNPWTSQCSTAGDTGYKNIMVQVSWTQGNKTNSIIQESLMTRY